MVQFFLNIPYKNLQIIKPKGTSLAKPLRFSQSIFDVQVDYTLIAQVMYQYNKDCQ